MRKPRILIIGVGGACSIKRMKEIGIPNADLAVVSERFFVGGF